MLTDVEIVEGDLVDESDEDSAPEDVSFGASKATALRKIKDTIELIQGERQKRKEKRKQQDEKFKHQKVCMSILLISKFVESNCVMLCVNV